MTKKIIKIDNNTKKETPKIELNEEELELKAKLVEIDRKIESVQNIMSSIGEDNKETLFVDEVVNNIIGLISITATTNLIGQYFGLEKVTLDDIIE